MDGGETPLTRAAALLACTLMACERQSPSIVAHRALGVAESTDENRPENIVLALQAGFGAEVDIRADGEGCGTEATERAFDGCFDLGHTSPNGRTFAELLDLLEQGWTPEMEGGALLLDVVNDPDRLISTSILPYLSERVTGTPLESLRWMLQSSSVEGIVLIRGQLEADPLDFPLLLGITWFVNPSLTVPDSADFAVVHVAELPLVPMPLPVGVFGVSSLSSYKQAIYAESEVAWVITDFPARMQRFADYP